MRVLASDFRYASSIGLDKTETVECPRQGRIPRHEIDYWNENGESTVWVNVPELTAETVIRAYWGFKPGKEPLARPISEAWADYAGVWHFSEEGGIVHDSSGNRYHSANDGGGTVSNVNAKVGLARTANGTAFLTGVTDLTSASATKRISRVESFSISGWMLSTATIGSSQYPAMMLKGEWTKNGWYACFESSPTKFNGVGTGATKTIVTLPTSVYNNWAYLTVVFNGTSCSVYEDGALVQTYAINQVSNSSYALRLANALTGRIDEFRIQNGVQSATYIEADYATLTDPGFLTYGQPRITAPTILIVQ
ncbi:MAG: hypothetical protein IJQ73_18010 [Kiritimatiellae bacterium]|nr:hypothetical protein [Kiritimatiellia bacterium]